MTTDEQQRLADLRRQQRQFAVDGGLGGAHNRKAGADRADRQQRNRRKRRRGRQRVRQQVRERWQ